MSSQSPVRPGYSLRMKRSATEDLSIWQPHQLDHAHVRSRARAPWQWPPGPGELPKAPTHHHCLCKRRPPTLPKSVVSFFKATGTAGHRKTGKDSSAAFRHRTCPHIHEMQMHEHQEISLADLPDIIATDSGSSFLKAAQRNNEDR
jgi:hypothetical protein